MKWADPRRCCTRACEGQIMCATHTLWRAVGIACTLRRGLSILTSHPPTYPIMFKELEGVIRRLPCGIMRELLGLCLPRVLGAKAACLRGMCVHKRRRSVCFGKEHRYSKMIEAEIDCVRVFCVRAICKSLRWRTTWASNGCALRDLVNSGPGGRRGLISQVRTPFSLLLTAAAMIV